MIDSILDHAPEKRPYESKTYAQNFSIQEK